MVWYSHLFQNFPQFAVIHTIKDFGIVSKAEVDEIRYSPRLEEVREVGIRDVSGKSCWVYCESPILPWGRVEWGGFFPLPNGNDI